MKTSETGLEAIEHREGFKNELYYDQAGLPTIGVGHLLTRDEIYSGKILIGGMPIRWHEGLASGQVLALFSQDVRSTEIAVNVGVKVSLAQNQFDTLVSFTFNVGSRAFLHSTLLKVLNRGNYEMVPDEMRRWIYSAGEVNLGLVERRDSEISQWNARI